MKAAQINQYGGQDVLIINNDTRKPAVQPDQVLVEVHSAGVNPFDWKVREGYMKDMVPMPFPATLGGDLAGIVTELGEGVTGFALGDAVYGQANAVSGVGSYAEFAPAAAESLAPKPKSTDFINAAALPLAGVSAYQALVDHMNLQAGQKILIHGGAGGIGSLAIQLAKHLGAYAATTATGEDVEFVKGLGADEVIDYKTQAFEESIKDYDVVFDTIGGETNAKSYQVLKPGGILVSMVEEPKGDLAEKHQVKPIHQSTKVTTERLNKLAGLVDQGVINPQVGKVFPLDQAAEALEYLKQGKHKGKVVLKVK